MISSIYPPQKKKKTNLEGQILLQIKSSNT